MINRNLKIVPISLPLLGLVILFLVPVAWTILYFGLYLGYGNYQTWGHQEFAANGVAQIEPASQMDQLFDDCRHFITYSGRDSVSTWNAVAFFGGRYRLTMQVPVEIESSTNGKMIGEPRFYLGEISKVSFSPSGQVGASFSNGLEFRRAEWKKVFKADGDFGAIGFKMKTGPPIKDFDAFAKASR